MTEPNLIQTPDCNFPECLNGGKCAFSGGMVKDGVPNRKIELCQTRPDYRWLWNGSQGIKPERYSDNWAVGVTTYAPRNQYLGKTLRSMQHSGFPQPRLFIDGVMEPPKGYPFTMRDTPVGAWANWLLALIELMQRQPNSKWYMIVQDDVLFCRGIRQYIDEISLSGKMYLNLYTWDKNEAEKGFHPAAKRGYGALALALPCEAAEVIADSTRSYIRVRGNEAKSKKNIDGAVWDCLTRHGYKEMVHSPSLTQHIGDETSLQNPGHRTSKTFPGESYDARDMLQVVGRTLDMNKTANRRILLYGYNTASGIGYLNRDMATWLPIERWLTVKHHSYNSLPLHPDVDTFACTSMKLMKLNSASKNMGVFLFTEQPLTTEVLPRVKRIGMKVVCIAMREWVPMPSRTQWTSSVDLFICPTIQCYNALKTRGYPCHYFPWPVDTDLFKFRKREKAEEFLFIGGRGGMRGRKGANEFFHAMELATSKTPDMRAHVSQQKSGYETPANCIQMAPQKNREGLYKKGDVLVYPSRWDGIGLQVLEAAACGIPSICTEGDPWNEYNPIGKISANVSIEDIAARISVRNPTPGSVLRAMESVYGSDISEASEEARAFAESRSWASKYDELAEIIFDSKGE